MDDERARYLAEMTRYNCDMNCVHLIESRLSRTGHCSFYGKKLAWDEGTGGWFMCDGCADDTYGKEIK